MAEFLTRKSTTAGIESIIRNAEQCILLISPYLKFDDDIKKRIEGTGHLTSVTVVYGKKKLQSEEDSWLKSIEWIETKFCKNLHAKCYLNEKEAILTSMNLYEYSQENNREMGIRVSLENDPKLYEEILKEARDIERISEVVEAPKKSKKVKETSTGYLAFSQSTKGIQLSTGSPSEGYCLRCKRPLKANPGIPYCETHLKSWDKYKNDKFEEKHCHLCAKSWKTSRAKPVCRYCYQKHKEFVEAALA